MPFRTCPTCANPGRVVTESTSGALEYYRCDRCGQAWVHDKNDPHHEAKPISYTPNAK